VLTCISPYLPQGDAGDNFYLIRSGEVKCTKVGSAEEVSRRLKKGDFFGERALLSSKLVA